MQPWWVLIVYHATMVGSNSCRDVDNATMVDSNSCRDVDNATMVVQACGELPDPMPDPHSRPNGSGCMESFGTNTGATLAFPANLSDPNLTRSAKLRPLNLRTLCLV